MKDLKRLDRRVIHQYGPIVIGIDEVGVGPLAGPTCACAVVLNLKKTSSINVGRIEVDDSKKLSRKQREILFPRIELVSTHRLGWVTVEEINATKNIHTSGSVARQRAYDKLVETLGVSPHAVISDYFKVATGAVPCIAEPKADQRSFIVACASIIAKVARDRYMLQCHEKFPQYDWSNNVGYGTKRHLDAIRVFGTTPLHRMHLIHVGAS